MLKFIAVSKTWANESNILYLNIPNYNIVSKERGSRGGGVEIYIKVAINHTVRDDLSAYSGTDFECVFIEVPVVHQRKTIVGCIYRAPGLNLHLFNKKLEQ